VRTRPKTLKEIDTMNLFGELEYFPYQFAIGLSIRKLVCKEMGWMLRLYFGPFKLWLNLKDEKDE